MLIAFMFALFSAITFAISCIMLRPHYSSRAARGREPSHLCPDCRCCTGEKTTVKEIADGILRFADDPTGTIVVLVDGVWRDDIDLFVADGQTNSAKDKVQRRIRKMKY